MNEIYAPNFLTPEKLEALWQESLGIRCERLPTKMSGYKVPTRRLQMPTYANNKFRRGDSTQEEVSDWMLPLEAAGPELKSLRTELTDLAGGDIDYFSYVGYQNEKDHISFHSHAEDGCRDARVFIISMGAARPFYLRKVCEACRLCDQCYATCDREEVRYCKDLRCIAAHENRKTCKVCRDKSKGIIIPATQGSLISLTDEMNRTHEHAVLDEPTPCGLRISINTKSTLSYKNACTVPPVAAVDEPRVWDCHAGKKYPEGAVYVGCRVAPYGKVIREGTIYGNSREPLLNHKTPYENFRAYAENRMADPAFYAQAIKDLRGKHLLCWCRPDEADRCHARVWLDLVNQSGEPSLPPDEQDVSGPAPPEPSQITDNIFQGSNDHAVALAADNPFGISAVLCVGTRAPYLLPPGVVSKRVPLKDAGPISLDDLRACVEFIRAAVNRNMKILVHCDAGRNRSTAIVIAFLLATGQYESWADAFAYVKTKRDAIGVAHKIRESVIAGLKSL
jgi:protein-tyrosine phosphatase